MCCYWGKKVFRNYLGINIKNWCDYDVSELVLIYKYNCLILIDVGIVDFFLV